MHIFLENGIQITTCVHDVMSLHNHDFLELVYVEEGSSNHTLKDEAAKIVKGNYFIVDYGISHKYVSQAGKTIKIINCLFTPDFIDKSLENCHSFNDVTDNYLIKINTNLLSQNPVRTIFYDEDGDIYRLMCQMRQEYENKNSGYLEIMRSNLIEIIIKSIRKISTIWEYDSMNNISQYIVKYIQENYSKSVSLSEIAGQLSYSVPYISKRFKEETGTKFSNYLQKYRMLQSGRLLLNTRKRITEIAELVGYGDIKSFNAVFKKHMKMTPQEFRKQSSEYNHNGEIDINERE